VFDSETRIGSFTETIRPGAFAASLRGGGDVIATLDHDLGKLLGRRSSGTLRLGEDSRGLAFECDLPDTTAGRDVEALGARGDLGGASFSFRPVREEWNEARTARTLHEVDLLEVCAVSAWPAYAQTSVAVRSRQHGPTRAALRRWCETL
jgi:hypothetical protein